jgi:hypothetical protein
MITSYINRRYQNLLAYPMVPHSTADDALSVHFMAYIHIHTWIHTHTYMVTSYTNHGYQNLLAYPMVPHSTADDALSVHFMADAIARAVAGPVAPELWSNSGQNTPPHSRSRSRYHYVFNHQPHLEPHWLLWSIHSHSHTHLCAAQTRRL